MAIFQNQQFSLIMILDITPTQCTWHSQNIAPKTFHPNNPPPKKKTSSTKGQLKLRVLCVIFDLTWDRQRYRKKITLTLSAAFDVQILLGDLKWNYDCNEKKNTFRPASTRSSIAFTAFNYNDKLQSRRFSLFLSIVRDLRAHFTSCECVLCSSFNYLGSCFGVARKWAVKWTLKLLYRYFFFRRWLGFGCNEFLVVDTELSAIGCGLRHSFKSFSVNNRQNSIFI